MLGLVGVILTIFALIIAILGIVGYKTIKEEAISRAEVSAREAARVVAEEMLLRAISGSDAAGYAESQKEVPRRRVPKINAAMQSDGTLQSKKPISRRKATSDTNLGKDDE